MRHAKTCGQMFGIAAFLLVVALFYDPALAQVSLGDGELVVAQHAEAIRLLPEPPPDLSKKLVPVAEDSLLAFTDGNESLFVAFEARDSADNEIDFRDVSGFTTVSQRIEGGYKWSYSFVLPREDFKATVRITADDSIRLLDGKFLVLDGDKFMSFEDVIAYGFTYEILVLSDNEAVVSFVKDWAKAGVNVGETVFIDPYVVSYPFHDGYLERRVTGAFEVYLTTSALDVGNNVGAGDADYRYRAYFDYNTSFIDPWDIIINATFYGRVLGKTCSSGSSRFWLQNISDFGDLGASDWDISYQNISIFFYANENASGWYTVNVSGWVVKGGSTFYRIQGSYEDYNGVDCFISVNSNESVYEPYVEIYYAEGSPVAPNITIHSPANATLTSDVVHLNVSSLGGTGPVSEWWYSLNGGSNVTFVPNTTVIVPLGSNCIMVWLNNTFGIQSMNQTCFTVSSYGSGLNCWVVPDELPVGQTLVDYCNYTYARNGSAVLDASCRVSLVDPIVIRRYYDIDDEEQFSNFSMSGFSVELSTDMYDIGGGAYTRCTNQTTGNISIWSFISDANPYTSLDGLQNITSVNYTYFLGSFSCDDMDALFGVKGSVLRPVNMLANQTWLQEKLASLGNPSMAYYGFFYGCPDCAGGDDSWYVGTNSHNMGYTFHGNLSQVQNWSVEGVEHAQWLFASVTRALMVYNASSGFYVQNHTVSEWAEPKQYAAFGNCSESSFENKTSYFSYNATGISLPSCSFDYYSLLVALGRNQTFAWSMSSMTTLFNKYAVLENSTNDVLLSVGSAGTYSYLMNSTGDFMLRCYVRNILGSYEMNVSFSVAVVDYQLSLFYSPYAVIGRPATIKAFIMANGTSIQVIPNLTIVIDGSSADMVWVPDDSAYEVIWIPSANGDYVFNVSGDLPPLFVEDGLIKVRTPYNITIRIWNNINMTAGSEYRNEFSWLYFIKDVDPTLHILFGRDRFDCPPEGPYECYWHAAYRNGTATITLYETGNFSLFIVGNNIDWYLINPAGGVEPCAFCAPVKTQSRLLMNLGSYYLTGAEDFDLYVNPTEIVVSGFSFGVFASWLSMGFFAIIAIVFFFVVLITTGSLKAAIAAMVILPTIIYLALNVFLW